MELKVGSKAPDFTLADNQDGQVKLSDLKGKNVLLSWHPLAWTSVCTDQMRALEANHDKFEKLNTVALGMSVDPAASKKVWVPPPEAPVQPMRCGSTSGSDWRKSTARMLFQVCSAMGEMPHSAPRNDAKRWCGTCRLSL